MSLQHPDKEQENLNLHRVEWNPNYLSNPQFLDPLDNSNQLVVSLVFDSLSLTDNFTPTFLNPQNLEPFLALEI